ncbi:MAG: Lrp/AsnC family transcriptional regulator [Azospirillaceae bacterium]
MATTRKNGRKGGVETANAALVPKATQQNLDRLSRDILALLQEDGRRSFSSIARELNVSEGAVRSRVSALEEHEHLRFIAVIDPVHVGYMCWAMLGIRVVPGASPHDLAMEFSRNPKAIWVSVMGGTYDLMVETWTESPADLQDFLEQHCYASGKIASVDTMVGMRIYKWGAPQV